MEDSTVYKLFILAVLGMALLITICVLFFPPETILKATDIKVEYSYLQITPVPEETTVWIDPSKISTPTSTPTPIPTTIPTEIPTPVPMYASPYLDNFQNISGLNKEYSSEFILGKGQLKADQPVSYIYYIIGTDGSKSLTITPTNSIKLLKDVTDNYPFQAMSNERLMNVKEPCDRIGDFKWVSIGTSTNGNFCIHPITKNPELHVPKNTVIKNYILTPEDVTNGTAPQGVIS